MCPLVPTRTTRRSTSCPRFSGTSPPDVCIEGWSSPGWRHPLARFAYQLREAGPLLTFAQVRTEDDLSAAVTAMNEVLLDALRNPVTGEEVDRAKTSLLNGVEQVP